MGRVEITSKYEILPFSRALASVNIDYDGHLFPFSYPERSLCFRLSDSFTAGLVGKGHPKRRRKTMWVLGNMELRTHHQLQLN